MISSPAKERIRARNTIFRLLKFRPRSRYEIELKLKTKKFPPAIIAETIEYFQSIDLINDNEFTRKWIAARLLKPLGIYRIRQELKAKGVAEEIIEREIQEGVSDYAEEDVVRALARKRMSKYKRIDKQKARRRIFEYLQRRGFNSSIIRKAVFEL